MKESLAKENPAKSEKSPLSEISLPVDRRLVVPIPACLFREASTLDRLRFLVFAEDLRNCINDFKSRL
jgi:hypothetical protein